MFKDGIAYTGLIMAGNMKDLKEDYIDPDKAFYSGKITCKQVGVFVNNSRVILFKDLNDKLSTIVKSCTVRQLTALVTGDLSNDNNSYYLLERGLLLADRITLSNDGLLVKEACLKDSCK